MLLLLFKHTLNSHKNEHKHIKNVWGLFYTIYIKNKTSLLCPTVAWDTELPTQDIIKHPYKRPFTHLLLYMQPKHSYKIKHHGHFKIKAHYLLERGFSVILHSSYCLLWSFVVVPDKYIAERPICGQKPAPRRICLLKVRRRGGGRASARKTTFCAGGRKKNELSGIRFLIDGSSLYGSSLLYFLHRRCSVHSTFILHSSRKARPVSSFGPAPIGPSKLSTWACSRDIKKNLKIQIV